MLLSRVNVWNDHNESARVLQGARTAGVRGSVRDRMAECRDAAAGEQAQYPAAGEATSADRDGRAGDCGAESERLATVSGNAIKYRRAKQRRHPRAHCPSSTHQQPWQTSSSRPAATCPPAQATPSTGPRLSQSRSPTVGTWSTTLNRTVSALLSMRSDPLASLFLSPPYSNGHRLTFLPFRVRSD